MASLDQQMNETQKQIVLTQLQVMDPVGVSQALSGLHVIGTELEPEHAALRANQPGDIECGEAGPGTDINDPFTGLEPGAFPGCQG